jgi:beta-N-acetylhexosaminidase
MTSQRMQIPGLVATDQEGGLVVRVGPPATQFPGNMALGAGRSTDDARRAAAISGTELAALGINQNFGPVADVNVSPVNPVIGVRSFSENPSLAAALTSAQVRGYHEGHVASTAKHFLGHGDTDTDSHTGIPMIDHTRAEVENIDLPPFEAAIERDVDAIMTAHIIVPSIDPSGDPATLSRPILTGVLRRQLGFDGVVITDSLGMAGVRAKYGDDRVPVLAIKAGVDMLLMPPDLDLAYNSVLEAVRSGEISIARLHASLERILRLKAELGLVEDPYVDVGRVGEVVGTAEHYADAQRIADRTTTLVKNDDGVLPLAPGSGQDVLVTGWGDGPTQTVADKMAERGVHTDVLTTGANPSGAQIDAAVTAASTHDLTVVTSYRAWENANRGQRSLVQRLLTTGTPVVVVSVRDAYDIAYYPQAPTYAVTYGYNDVALESLVRVLFGEVNPAGRLPVTIPTADDPGTALFPFGHGLSY